MLSDRKKKILQAVIEEYIENASPVGSKYIQETYFEDLSPATIRNELAVLENMGLLSHPHTSAGRVPTTVAYKLYIDELIEQSNVKVEEFDSIKRHFDLSIRETEYVANQVVKVLSDMTNYTSVASIHKHKEKINNVKLIKFSQNVIVLITVMDSGSVNDYKVYGNFIEGEEYVKTAEALLNKHLIGKSLEEIDLLETLVIGELEEYKELFGKIHQVFRSKILEKENVLLSGESKIFDHPEYGNIEDVKDFIFAIDSKENINKVLKSGDNSVKINVAFGGESEEIPKDCSLVSAHYVVDDVDFGTFGVIGPSRMDYNKVIRVLNSIKEVLEEIVNNK
ncbi:MAG: heat-inducible transcription repressor HrcA [Clostridia bacterium]|nr:heat-inducible transcription repressor HrcA [Clostridia bacterium]